jgi:hypothetical protein
MWTHTYSKTFKNVKKETIWQLWTDVNNWPTWQEDLDYCKLEGPFVVGNHFMLKPKGVKAFKIELTEIEEGRKFTDCTTFFGAKMYGTLELEETKEGLCLTNIHTVTGPLRWLWIKLVAQNVAHSASQQMEALVERARSHG